MRLRVDTLCASAASAFGRELATALPQALNDAAGTFLDGDDVVGATTVAEAVLRLLASGAARLPLTRVEFAAVPGEPIRLDAAEVAGSQRLAPWLHGRFGDAVAAWMSAGAGAGVLEGLPEIAGLEFLRAVDLGPMLPADGACVGVRFVMTIRNEHGSMHVAVVYGRDFLAVRSALVAGVQFVDFGRRSRLAQQAAERVARQDALVVSGETAIAVFEKAATNPPLH